MDPLSRMSPALLVPEILQMIFEHLETERSALFSAIQVNKTWAHEATNILWRRPCYDALLDLSDDRRQQYANKIQGLEFGVEDDTDTCHIAFKDLKFSQLRWLVPRECSGPEDEPSVPIEQYLQPRLKTFLFFGLVSGNLLTTLEQNCPRLRRIHLGRDINTGRDVGDISGRILRFLQKYKYLESVELGARLDSSLAGEMFSHLAHSTVLQRLDITTMIRPEEIERAFLQPGPIFQSLRILEVEVDSRSIPLLLSRTEPLKILTLYVRNPEVNFFHLLPAGLEHLWLHFKGEKNISQSEFLELRRCTNLRTLKIGSYPVNMLYATSITDDDFREVFSSFTQLCNLDLGISHDLSTEALNVLGRNCRQLNTCNMYGLYDLLSWKHIDAPLFPALEVLFISGVENRGLMKEYV